MFSYDINTDLGKLRLAIGDTKPGHGIRPGNCNFSNEELQSIMDGYPTWEDAVSPIFHLLSTEWLTQADSISFAGYSRKSENKANAFRKQAAAWEKQLSLRRKLLFGMAVHQTVYVPVVAVI